METSRQPLALIVAATDFSPRTGRAVKRAAALAHHHGAALELLHVLGRLPLEAVANVLWTHPLETEKWLADAASARLAQTAGLLRQHYSIAVRHHVAVGAAHAEICSYAKGRAADLVVVGAHGENFVRDLFLGSTASKVLRKSPVPVLIVRAEEEKPYERVVVGMDFSRWSAQVLEMALRLAPKATVTTVHAAQVPFESRLLLAGATAEEIERYRAVALEDARLQMSRFLAAHAEEAGRITPVVVHGYPPAAIAEQVRVRGADLVAVGKHGCSELEESLLGSVSKHVSYETECDVLMVGAR
jgi:universal stress protein E